MEEWALIQFVADADFPVTIPAQDVQLDGLLHIPRHAQGIILFVHGSGSGRFSPRNQFIAHLLQKENYATLLFDLLTADEDIVDETTLAYRFDIELLAKRLLNVTHWAVENPVLHKLPMGYFGASTGGGAALLAAAQPHSTVKSIVSRGGRPDLAGRHALALVEAPTLLIIGGNDEVVIDLNQSAFDQLNCEKEMVIVPGASHLFEEAGKLDEVAALALRWFKQYLVGLSTA